MRRASFAGTKFGGGTPAVERFSFTTGQEARAGKNSFPPTPFLFARPSENYQKSASGFSRKKVRILFKTDSQLVKFRFPASLGASPLASANEFSSNFQTNQSFFARRANTKRQFPACRQAGLPKSDYKFNQIKL